MNVRERILKPVNEVFYAVVDPNKISNYFISGASGPIKVGRVEWEFGDVGAKVPIDDLKRLSRRLPDGFDLTQPLIEVFGLCRRCRAKT